MAVEEVTLTGTSESLRSGWNKYNATTKAMLVGDTTAKKFYRIINLTIEDGTAGTSIKVTGASVYNGDTVAAEDSITKGGTGTYVSLDSDGNILTIDSDGITGDCQAVISAEIYRNAGGELILCDGVASSNDIQLTFRKNDDSDYDLAAHVDIGELYVKVTYLTDA